jgi:CMP-N,N'-diacetyllegionaminic acid synthase
MSDFQSGSEAVGFVPVRGGSKGLPGKNIRMLGGKPLYLHAVEQALRTTGRCIVSTDIPDILAADPPLGCSVIERPPELAGDSVAMDAVIAHMLDTVGSEFDQIVLLQATSPMRNDDDIRSGLALYRCGDFDLVLSVTQTEASVLKFGTLEDGRFMPVSKPAYCFTNRQDLPNVFKPNGAVYVFTAEAFRRNGGLATSRIGAFEMPGERSADIDTLEDFARIEDAMWAVASSGIG